MKVAALFSGGKDSTYAIYLAQMRGWNVARLITMVPEKGESYMFHVPNIGLCDMLAEAMGIPHTAFPTQGAEELELDDLRKALTGQGVEGIITGAIASDYQSTRIDRLCHELDMRSFSPIWRWGQEAVLTDILAAGFKVMIVGVYADGLGKEWLGRILDSNSMEKLKALSEKNRMNISGEGGEFETLVIDGPNFLKKLEIIESETIWDGSRGEMKITEARLVPK
ncbi:MAG: diphthine--ammonia ligase [Candidatus Thermoplasmatota archaeon]|nr:diphthine--ammonia ligase [Euryarchaeota archaeon]MBU4031813.1 diphthine--ammonia ligase [Candidatus Thermoplasmatota archaeon]MBU4072047.1 diphthine--ammonia ligase [Candidatus Thermoplasmatota archaeon]MBU4144578.1 diphthine--ammonia ligase [Candidatus Thermoplasmatota archaeon]MBU4592127.1 diphthine--ammonia ligase [Candidatus Thermoplasmatota archaeon]